MLAFLNNVTAQVYSDGNNRLNANTWRWGDSVPPSLHKPPTHKKTAATERDLRLAADLHGKIVLGNCISFRNRHGCDRP